VRRPRTALLLLVLISLLAWLVVGALKCIVIQHLDTWDTTANSRNMYTIN
jgi:hypothetical protein